MNSVIETNGFTYWLRFKSLGQTEWYQIGEPKGSDTFNSVVKQSEGRFGRDIFYTNEEIGLTFYRDFVGELIDTEQVTSPSGIPSKYLDHGFEWIMQSRLQHGYEMEIEFGMKKDGLFWAVGIFDAPNEETDGATFYTTTIIQNTQLSNYKKRLDDSIDMFATKNFKDETITPAPTLKFLRKAVPITKQSSWSNTAPTGLYPTFSSPYFYCFNTNITNSDIDQTKSSIAEVARWSSAYPGDGWLYWNYLDVSGGAGSASPGSNGGSMKLLTARQRQENVYVRIRFKGVCKLTGSSPYPHPISFTYIAMANNGDVKGNWDAGNYAKVVDIPLVLNTNVNIDIDQTYLLPFNVEADQTLYGWFTPLMELDRYYPANCDLTVEECYVEVTASEVAIDTVQSGVRWIDMAKQGSKFINNLPIDAPMFDVTGEHYNNVCYNRAMLTIDTSNSLALLNDNTPAGQNYGDVITNIDDTVLPLGRYFWDGSFWLPIDNPTSVSNISLISETSPIGLSIGELRYNTNTSVNPVGLCFWNGTSWQSLQYARPFITSLKDILELSMTIETCADYQLQDDKIFIGKFEDFYTDTEIAVIEVVPEKEYKERYNERFKTNSIKLAYDTFEQFRLAKNTANDIHTEAEWSQPNIYVKEKFDRSIKFVRSGFSAQEMNNLETRSPQTAYENDDKVYIVSIVPFEVGSSSRIVKTLFMNISGGKLQITNKAQNESDSDVIFRWDMAGITLNQDLEIVSGDNVGMYTVESFTKNIITLIPQGFTPTYNGDSFVKITFEYLNILWQTKTNEGFSIVQNLENPDRTPNLDYTLRRNLQRWAKYFSTSELYRTDKPIINRYFKNNPALITRKTGETFDLVEKGNWTFDQMETPILDTQIIEAKVKMDFPTAIDVIDKIKTQRGFVRMYTADGRVMRGYIQEFDNLWKFEELNLIAEKKYVSDVIELVYASGILTLDNAQYDVSGNVNWWILTGEYFQAFDNLNRPLCNTYHYSKVNLNGVVYTSIDDLYSALSSL